MTSVKRNTVMVLPKSNEEPRYFVWIKNTKGGADPQIWIGDKLKGTGDKQKGEVTDIDKAAPGEIVGFNPLPSGGDVSMDRLVLDYPCPKSKAVFSGIDLATSPDRTVGVKVQDGKLTMMSEEELKQLAEVSGA